jgi:entericidin B
VTRKLIALALILLFAAVLAGCNTVHGVGKDIEIAGEAIKKASDKK